MANLETVVAVRYASGAILCAAAHGAALGTRFYRAWIAVICEIRLVEDALRVPETVAYKHRAIARKQVYQVWGALAGEFAHAASSYAAAEFASPMGSRAVVSDLALWLGLVDRAATTAGSVASAAERALGVVGRARIVFGSAREAENNTRQSRKDRAMFHGGYLRGPAGAVLADVAGRAFLLDCNNSLHCVAEERNARQCVYAARSPDIQDEPRAEMTQCMFAMRASAPEQRHSGARVSTLAEASPSRAPETLRVAPRRNRDSRVNPVTVKRPRYRAAPESALALAMLVLSACGDVRDERVRDARAGDVDGGAECRTACWCADDNPCTLNQCLNGVCVAASRSDEPCLSVAGFCDGIECCRDYGDCFRVRDPRPNECEAP